MFDRLEFINYGSDGLTGSRWVFQLLDHKLVLDAYEEVRRETARHKPRSVRGWYRLNARSSKFPFDEIPFNDVIAQQAKGLFVRQLEAKLTVIARRH